MALLFCLLGLAIVIGLFAFANHISTPSGKVELSAEQIIQLEDDFEWCVNHFGEDKLRQLLVLEPKPSTFPIKLQNIEDDFAITAKVIAAQMDINIQNVKINFYDAGIYKPPIYSGDTYNLEADAEYRQAFSTGMYIGEMYGKYEVAFNTGVTDNDPDNIISAVASEFAHIKLLAEKRISEKNDRLAECVVIFWGLGLFLAETSYQTFTDFHLSARAYRKSYKKSGYLNEWEIAYSLALFAHYRNEQNPHWARYLTATMKQYVQESIIYINNNQVSS